MMVKQPGWERFVAEWARLLIITPFAEVGFVWGITDCWSLVVGAVQAMRDAAWDDVPLPGGPTDALRATRDAIAEFGSVVGWFEAQGFTAKPMVLAHTGDILVREPDEDGLPWFGVVVANDVIASAHDTGAYRCKMTDVPPTCIALTVR